MRQIIAPLFFLTCLVLAACGQSDSSTNSNGDTANNNAITLPAALVGQWQRSIERNGSTGTAVFEITAQGMVQSYEIGDNAIMEEWYGSLDSGFVYKFWSEPAQAITAINDNSITLADVDDATAYIIDNNTQQLVVSWDIQTIGIVFDYVMPDDNTLIISAEFNGQTVSYSYSRM